MLSFAAREADIVSLANVPFDAVGEAGRTPTEDAEHRYAMVREAAGDRISLLEVESSPFFTRITDDPAAAAERVGRTLGVPPEGLPDHPNVLIGTLDEVIDRLQERRERFGANYITVQQGEAERFAPVVARLTGT